MHCDGLRGRRRPLHKDRQLKEDRQSVLQRRSDSRLVRADGARNQAYPRPKNSASRPEDPEHLHELERVHQDWRLRYCPRPAAHVRLRDDGDRHAVLPVARDLLREALQPKVRHLVARLHSVRNGNSKARI